MDSKTISLIAAIKLMPVQNAAAFLRRLPIETIQSIAMDSSITVASHIAPILVELLTEHAEIKKPIRNFETFERSRFRYEDETLTDSEKKAIEFLRQNHLRTPSGRQLRATTMAHVYLFISLERKPQTVSDVVVHMQQHGWRCSGNFASGGDRAHQFASVASSALFRRGMIKRIGSHSERKWALTELGETIKAELTKILYSADIENVRSKLCSLLNTHYRLHEYTTQRRYREPLLDILGYMSYCNAKIEPLLKFPLAPPLPSDVYKIIERDFPLLPGDYVRIGMNRIPRWKLNIQWTRKKMVEEGSLRAV